MNSNVSHFLSTDISPQPYTQSNLISQPPKKMPHNRQSTLKQQQLAYVMDFFVNLIMVSIFPVV